tara:strand:- start:111 stop:389 length:279 start_codon:yes stop_codon:yes gene_type:complete
MSKKKITFKPTRDWILVPDPRKEETDSGIILTGESKNSLKTNVLEVLATGPECKWVKVGDTVMVDPSGKGHIIDLDGESYVVLAEFMILGIM